MSDEIVETEGDTFGQSIEFTDSDDNPIDITGWELFVTVKDSYKDADVDAVLSQEVTTHDNASAGETSFSFTNDETEGLEGRYVYEIKYKDNDGTVETIISRTIRFTNAVREDIN